MRFMLIHFTHTARLFWPQFLFRTRIRKLRKRPASFQETYQVRSIQNQAVHLLTGVNMPQRSAIKNHRSLERHGQDTLYPVIWIWNNKKSALQLWCQYTGCKADFLLGKPFSDRNGKTGFCDACFCIRMKGRICCIHTKQDQKDKGKKFQKLLVCCMEKIVC